MFAIVGRSSIAVQDAKVNLYKRLENLLAVSHLIEADEIIRGYTRSRDELIQDAQDTRLSLAQLQFQIISPVGFRDKMEWL